LVVAVCYRGGLALARPLGEKRRNQEKTNYYFFFFNSPKPFYVFLYSRLALWGDWLTLA